MRSLLSSSKSWLPGWLWWAARLVPARPVGVFKSNGPLHPPARTLPLFTVRSSQLSSGARVALLDLFTPRGLFVSYCFLIFFHPFPSRCWLRSCGDSICSPRALFQCWIRETFSAFVSTVISSPFSWHLRGQHTRSVLRYRRPLHPTLSTTRAVWEPRRDFLLILIPT